MFVEYVCIELDDELDMLLMKKNNLAQAPHDVFFLQKSLTLSQVNFIHNQHHKHHKLVWCKFIFIWLLYSVPFFIDVELNTLCLKIRNVMVTDRCLIVCQKSQNDRRFLSVDWGLWDHEIVSRYGFGNTFLALRYVAETLIGALV